jgi:biopolymer transport protein ExbD
LTLVIIIMVISPMVMQSMIQVQASQAVAGKFKGSVNEKPLFVDITAKGTTLNNKAMPTEYDLYRALQQRLTGMKERTVLVSSAQDVRYEHVVRVLDIVKQSGALSLSLVPRKKDAS